jgi:alkylation response protein AidB-like acyl-CoA dehydrogenase
VVTETQTVAPRLEAVLPAIRARREEIERARRLPADVVDELRGTGIFSLAVPRAIGGIEAAPSEILPAIEAVAAADGSAGWCAMIAITANSVAGYMQEDGAREVFGDPNAPSAAIAAPTGTAERVDGGVRVSGRWAFASGVTHSDWIWVGCVVTEDGRPRMTPSGPEVVHACIPVGEVEIHDTWFVSGLSGTGSNDVSVAGATVPEQRLFSLFDPATHRPEPLYQMPPLGLFVSHVVAVSLGIARRALDELIELAQTKVPSLSQAVLADRPVAQIDLARAEASLGAARAFLYETLEDLWQTVCAGGVPTARQLAANRIAALNAAETGASVARVANVLAGGSSIYTASSLQRHMRDAEAITHHFTLAPHVWEDAGRVFLGRSPTAPIF